VNRRLSLLILLLLLVGCFSLAAILQPRTEYLGKSSGSDNVLKVLLGDGRKLFANHFFVQADVYFHNGYYPGIFDQNQAPKDSRHMTGQGDEHEEDEHVRQMAFLGPPRDWVERFGRHFLVTEHSHLEGSKEREILPWLRISAELDPHRIETYTVSSYWLRRQLGKPQEAEKFLRDGLRHNPNSYELLFELGQLYLENYREPDRARNVWELALKRWHEQQDGAKEPDLISLEEIAVHLARLEEQAGNLASAITYLEIATKASPHREILEKQISELRNKLAPK
jgi:tetratricopeptide (TPR) repeat protein